MHKKLKFMHKIFDFVHKIGLNKHIKYTEKMYIFMQF